MEAVGAAFGLADAALRASSKLWSLSGAWRDAPGDLHRLRDDLSRTQRFFAETQEGINSMYELGRGVHKESHSSLREMERLLDEGHDVLQQIETFVDSLDRPKNPANGLDDELREPRELGKRRKLLWMTSTRKINRLRGELRSITSNVCRLLIAQNVSTSAEIYMSLERTYNGVASLVGDRLTSNTEQSPKAHQNTTVTHLGKALEMSQHAIMTHMDRRLEMLEAKMTQTRIGPEKPGFNDITMTNIQQIQLHVNKAGIDTPPPFREIDFRTPPGKIGDTHVHDTEIGRGSEFTSWTPPSALLHTGMSHRRLCDSDCRCRCHRPSSYNWIMSSMKPILGDIAISYLGYATQDCTARGCQYFGQTRRPSRKLHLMYSFPSWLARASLYILYSSNLHGNPELVIRVMNRLPLEHLQPQSIFGRVRAGDIEAVKAILRAGTASVNDVVANTGISLLLYAMVYGGTDMTRMLLQSGADPFQVALVGTGNAVSYAFQLMLNGKYLETVRLFPIDRFIEDMEFPPLFRVVMKDLHMDLAEALRRPEYVADVNHLTPGGHTALDIAVHRGDIEAMRLLVLAGANVNAVTGPRESTALLRSCINGNYEAAKMLLEAGASIHAVDRYRNGCITLAAKAPVDSSRLMALLMQYGMDVETPGALSQSPPLVHAVVDGTVATIRFLISRGANLNPRDHEGDTPITDAILRDYDEKVRALLEYDSCDLQNINVYGRGVLHFLASHGSVEVMRAFIDKKIEGLNPDVKDNNGKTPSHLFSERRQPPNEELRRAFDELMESLERGYYGGSDDDSGEDEFVDARETPD